MGQESTVGTWEWIQANPLSTLGTTATICTVMGVLWVIFHGEDFKDSIKRWRKQPPQLSRREVERQISLLLGQPGYRICRRFLRWRPFLPMIEEVEYFREGRAFFKHKSDMLRSAGPGDCYCVILARPFFHLTRDERQGLEARLGRAAATYLDDLERSLAASSGPRMVYYVDLVQSDKELRKRNAATAGQIAQARADFEAFARRHKQRLTVYALKVDPGLDCMLVDTSDYRNEVVFGLRVHGREGFTAGVRMKSKRLYDAISDRLCQANLPPLA